MECQGPSNSAMAFGEIDMRPRIPGLFISQASELMVRGGY